MLWIFWHSCELCNITWSLPQKHSKHMMLFLAEFPIVIVLVTLLLWYVYVACIQFSSLEQFGWFLYCWTLVNYSWAQRCMGEFNGAYENINQGWSNDLYLVLCGLLFIFFNLIGISKMHSWMVSVCYVSIYKHELG